jgi:hypothetical protein
MSVYSLGVMLEDPFDTGAGAATDTLSLTEFMHTLAYVSGVGWGGGDRGQGWAVGQQLPDLAGGLAADVTIVCERRASALPYP